MRRFTLLPWAEERNASGCRKRFPLQRRQPMPATAFVTGIETPTTRPIAPVQLQQPIAALTNVTKRYGATAALDGLNLALRPAEALALLGPNGARKSTAVR